MDCEEKTNTRLFVCAMFSNLSLLFRFVTLYSSNAVNLRIINQIAQTVTAHYYSSNPTGTASAAVTLGPYTYTNISIDGVLSGTVWAELGANSQCPVVI